MQKNVLSLFPERLCLTLKDSPRAKQAKEEFDRVGLSVDFFLAYPGDDPFKSFNRSQHEIVKDIALSGKSTLVFEDDVVFKDCSHVEAALQQLPLGWDILYLGANITEERPERYSENLCRIRSAWTTHAIAYNPRVAAFIAEFFPLGAGDMYDDWLSRVVLPRFACYIINPMVCWQRKGKSELWGRDTDYEPCFEAGNEKMKY